LGWVGGVSGGYKGEARGGIAPLEAHVR